MKAKGNQEHKRDCSFHTEVQRHLQELQQTRAQARYVPIENKYKRNNCKRDNRKKEIKRFNMNRALVIPGTDITGTWSFIIVRSFNIRHKNQNYSTLLCLCLENYWVFGATSKKCSPRISINPNPFANNNNNNNLRLKKTSLNQINHVSIIPLLYSTPNQPLTPHIVA